MTRRTFGIGLLWLLLLVLTAPALSTVLLGLVPRLQGLHLRLAQAAAFLHYGTALWLLALVSAVVLWRLTRVAPAAFAVLLTAGGLLLQGSWIAPYHRADTAAAKPVLGVTVLNVQMGFGGDREQLVRRLGGSDAVVLIEATPDTVTALDRAGMDRRFPHRVGRGREGVHGTVIYSRMPLTDLGVGPTQMESRLVRVQTPTGPVLLAGVHPCPPVADVGTWAVEGAALHHWLEPHLQQDIVVAGDFNAIDRHVTMQPWWRSGLRDSAELSGSGLPLTWPVGGFGPVPTRLVGIDHVLVSRRLTAQRHETLVFDDTDHAAVRVTVARYT